MKSIMSRPTAPEPCWAIPSRRVRSARFWVVAVREQSPLLIGAVKTNLGHLEAAAGMAGFIKAVLAVQRASIPANLHFQTPNPHISFDQTAAESRCRATGVAVSRAAAAGRGVLVRVRRHQCACGDRAGSGRHSVCRRASDPAVTHVGGVGQDTRSALRRWPAVLAEWMDGDGADVALPDVAHTLNHHRDHARPVRHGVRPRSRPGGGGIAGAGRRPKSADGVVGPHEGPCGPGTVFVYSGQGSHWAGMGRQLLVDEPVFAAAIAELEPVFVEQVGFSLWQVIADGEPVSGDARVQPVLMGLQLALTELWRSYGVHPDAVIGHSMGEVTAAVVAGALTVADGLRVIATRSRLMSQLAGQGAVALLKLDAEATAAVDRGLSRGESWRATSRRGRP